MRAQALQTAAAIAWGQVVHLLYPPRCLSCGEMVDSDFGLCSTCWSDLPLVGGVVCDQCGLPLPGGTPGEIAHCDDCLRTARPWRRGRAAMEYNGQARKLVLALKHGDRLDLSAPGGRWLARAARPMVQADTLLAPVPLHWSRMLKRRYNQSALLANAAARELDRACCPDLLVRRRRTQSLEGKTRDERFAQLDGAIIVHPRRHDRIAGRAVLLVDDVMTSGATLAASAEACYAAGARDVCVVTLARVAKTP